MALFYKTLLIFFSLGCFTLANGAPSYKISMKYKAYWGGFTVAEIDSEAVMLADTYEISADYQVKGIALIVGKMQNHTEARGILHRTGEYRPEYYESQGNFGKFKYSNQVTFNPNNLKVIEHKQNLELREGTEYIPIDELDRHGTDPMTLFLNMIMNERFNEAYKTEYRDRQYGGIFVSNQSFICDEQGMIDADSRSVFAGEATACKIDGRLLAGGIRSTDPNKKRRRGREDDDQDSRLWFGKMPGFQGMLPVYTEFKMGWGKVRIYLDDFKIEPITSPIITANNVK